MSTRATVGGRRWGIRAGIASARDLRQPVGFWLALLAVLLQLITPLHCLYQAPTQAADLAQFNPLPGFELSICGGHHALVDRSDHRQTDDDSCQMCCAVAHYAAMLSVHVVTVFAAPSATIQPAAQDLILPQAQFTLARSRAPPLSI